MPEAIARASALGSALGQPRGVRLAERSGLGKLDLRGDPADRGFMTAAGRCLDMLLPTEPDTSSAKGTLTALWAGLLGALAIADFVLALLAVPGGLLDGAGIAPPVAVPHAAWSWFANGLNYGLVGALFVGEYFYRVRRFPGRYTSFFDFLRRMGGLGPNFWRDALRDAPLPGSDARG